MEIYFFKIELWASLKFFTHNSKDNGCADLNARIGNTSTCFLSKTERLKWQIKKSKEFGNYEVNVERSINKKRTGCECSLFFSLNGHECAKYKKHVHENIAKFTGECVAELERLSMASQ